QAEDGIRYRNVTGVQTCALPIYNSIYSSQKSSVLVDKTKSGKVRPWREKKIANVGYFELLHVLELKKSERVKDCANVLEFKKNIETGVRKLYRVWFCKDRKSVV